MWIGNLDIVFKLSTKQVNTAGILSQINYADMLKKIDPLRNELKDLETQANENQQKAEEVNKTIAGLEKSIAKYKEEYAVLISQAQAIKTDLSNVEAKVSLGTIRGGGA